MLWVKSYGSTRSVFLYIPMGQVITFYSFPCTKGLCSITKLGISYIVQVGCHVRSSRCRLKRWQNCSSGRIVPTFQAPNMLLEI